MEKINTLIHAEGMYFVFAIVAGRETETKEVFPYDDVRDAVRCAGVMARIARDSIAETSTRVFVSTNIIIKKGTENIDHEKTDTVFEFDFSSLKDD